jgi:hypothetical protein
MNKEYKKWLADLKSRIRKSQIKAAVKVNTELLLFYWGLGQDIVTMQLEATWGSGFIKQLSIDLRKEFPYMQGFSERNLASCRKFYQFYSSAIPQQPVTKITGKKSTPILHQVGTKLSSTNRRKNKPTFPDCCRNHKVI